MAQSCLSRLCVRLDYGIGPRSVEACTSSATACQHSAFSRLGTFAQSHFGHCLRTVLKKIGEIVDLWVQAGGRIAKTYYDCERDEVNVKN